MEVPGGSILGSCLADSFHARQRKATEGVLHKVNETSEDDVDQESFKHRRRRKLIACRCDRRGFVG